MRERVVSITSELVAFPTHEAELDAQSHLAGILGAAGFHCELQEVEPRRVNLLARRGSGGVLLCSHMDTHPPHAHPEPLRMEQRDGELIGRGVLDAKGQIAALVAAVEAEDADATILITCDEEGGGIGSERATIPDGPWRTDGAIVLEPTNFRFCTAQGGHVDLRIEARAPAAHAYSVVNGRGTTGAVQAVVDVIGSLREMPALRTDHPLLPRPWLHIGTISGGEHLWRRAGGCVAEVGMALVPGVSTDEVVGQITEIVRRTAQGWDVEGSHVGFEIIDRSEPVEVPADLPVASWLADAPGTSLQPGGMMSWTDAANLLAHHAIPAVIFGAGDLRTAHSDDERIAVDDLVRLGEILRTVLRSAGTAR